MKRVVLSIIGLFFLAGCFASQPTSRGVDAVIFSFDRPLQLYALLESMEQYMQGVNEIHVLYRASSPEYQTAYAKVFNRYSYVKQHAQGTNPQQDFKPLTLQATFDSPAEYVIFAVDDIVVKDTVDLNECTRAMNAHHAYGFFLRLGTHLNYCYATNRPQSPPACTQMEPTMVAWQFGHGHHDWGYPHTVDMTVYRKKDIEPTFRQLPFENPNLLEARWSDTARAVAHRIGLCYTNSKIVNLPLNRVQHTFANRAMNQLSAQDLLKIFNENKKMDIKPLAQIKNNAAHMEYVPTFIAQ